MFSLKLLEYMPTGWMQGGVWRRMDTCICKAEYLCCSPEMITLLISYTPIQNVSGDKNKIKNKYK